eukprot:7174082-Prymnesium_polylepis.1
MKPPLSPRLSLMSPLRRPLLQPPASRTRRAGALPPSAGRREEGSRGAQGPPAGRPRCWRGAVSRRARAGGGVAGLGSFCDGLLGVLPMRLCRACAACQLR